MQVSLIWLTIFVDFICWIFCFFIYGANLSLIKNKFHYVSVLYVTISLLMMPSERKQRQSPRGVRGNIYVETGRQATPAPARRSTRWKAKQNSLRWSAKFGSAAAAATHVQISLRPGGEWYKYKRTSGTAHA